MTAQVQAYVYIMLGYGFMILVGAYVMEMREEERRNR